MNNYRPDPSTVGTGGGNGGPAVDTQARQAAATANTRNAEQDTLLGDLQSADVALDGRLDAAEAGIAAGVTKDASQDAATVAVADRASALEGRATAGETKDAAQDGLISGLQSADTALGNRATALEGRATAGETKDTSQDGLISTNATNIATEHATNVSQATDLVNLAGRASAVETKNTAQDVRLDAGDTKDTTQDGRLTTLEGAVPDLLYTAADVLSWPGVAGDTQALSISVAGVVKGFSISQTSVPADIVTAINAGLAGSRGSVSLDGNGRLVWAVSGAGATLAITKGAYTGTGTLTGIATTASMTAKSASIARAADLAKLKTDAAAANVAYRRVFLGIHAITSGTTFDKSALLARSFMQSAIAANVEVDLYLVGGGGAGAAYTYADSSGVPGGRQGDVRIIKGLPLSSLVDGTALAVGAGGAKPTANVSLVYPAGGDTVFGSYRAKGGSYLFGAASALSDVPLGAPGGGYKIASSNGIDAAPSAGPGAGGGSTGGVSGGGAGGASNPHDASLSAAGGAGGGPNAGGSVAAESFGYGGGGGGTIGSNGNNAGDGGFPGGGGGTYGSTGGGSSGRTGGAGGNGVIRLAVYEYRKV